MNHVDTLLINCTIVTMDDSYRIIENGSIAIKNDSVVEIGPSAKIQDKYAAENVHDFTGLVVTPGLVNAHTHVPMTLLRGLADDLRLDVWLMGYMMPVEREFVDEGFVELGTKLACAEMLLSGITTFNDMYYYEDSVARATAQVGMRAVCGQTVLKFPSPDSTSYEEGLTRCRDFIEDWHQHPLIIPAVAPHAPYTATPDMLEKCANLAIEYDVPLHIHLSETALEVLNSREEHDMPVIPWVKKHGVFNAKVIAAHCVHVDHGEIHTLEHHKAGVAHNPTSNLKLASGIAPVGKMLEVGVNVGIGTDGPASNNDLDMFEETRLAAVLAKAQTDNPTTLPARKAFEMATRMGAQALHIGDLTGSLEAGKRADLLVLDLSKVHNLPSFHRDENALYSRLVYATKSTDVKHVMVNGQWLMQDRQFLTLDLPALLDEAEVVAHKIDQFLMDREGDILSKLLAIGELHQQESFEVQVKARIASPEIVKKLSSIDGYAIVREVKYKQYDTYFHFGPPQNIRLRYREDDFITVSGEVSSVRARLTLTEAGKEREFDNAVLLSRSRYIADATRPLRFYREYVQADSETTIVKERLRWHIDYQGERYYINIDMLSDPASDQYFIEIKSRTWSLSDAEHKAETISTILEHLEIPHADLIHAEYPVMSDK